MIGPSYGGIHQEVRRINGPAKKHQCQHCEARADAWALNWPQASEIWLSREGHKFSKNIGDYIALCDRCHSLMDAKTPLPFGAAEMAPVIETLMMRSW